MLLTYDGKEGLVVFRVVIVRLSSPLLFCNTQGPSSLGLMEQTQNKHAHLARPLRNSLAVLQLHSHSRGRSLLHFPANSLLFSPFIQLLLPLVISAYLLTIVLGFHVRQPENLFHPNTAQSLEEAALA